MEWCKVFILCSFRLFLWKKHRFIGYVTKFGYRHDGKRKQHRINLSYQTINISFSCAFFRIHAYYFAQTHCRFDLKTSNIRDTWLKKGNKWFQRKIIIKLVNQITTFFDSTRLAVNLKLNKTWISNIISHDFRNSTIVRYA